MRSARPRRTFTSWILLVLGCLCLGQGLSKALLWTAGARAPGHIAFQENAVSSRGATWVRYRFTTADGKDCSGTAMTAAKGARFARVQIAYLPFLPGVNMPAYAGYAALMGLAWSTLGLLLMGISLLFRKAHPSTHGGSG